MGIRVCYILWALALQSLTYCGFTCADTEDSYLGAVVEFAADENCFGLGPLDRLHKNLENYTQIIAQASARGADIIVFPEYGLTTLTFFRKYGARNGKDPLQLIDPLLQIIPEPGMNPCKTPGFSQVITNLSCAANQGNIWLVVNLGEKVIGAEEEILYRYNTAIVFDRNGTLVAKYHKQNLFAEPWFDHPETTEVISFETDFGVRFGVIICFDLLFESPAKELVSQGLEHFVFPTAWIDELPYLTALQAQMMWASSSKATLLASGYHSPPFGKLGSGVFLPSGEAAAYIFDPTSGSRTVYSNVLKHFSSNQLNKASQTHDAVRELLGEEIQDLQFYYRENLSNYTAVSLSQDSELAQACDAGFCCEIRYKFSKVEKKLQQDCSSNAIHVPEYKLIVFNQTRPFQSPSVVKTMALQLCSLVRCLNSTIQSCAEHDASVHLPSFSYLQLTASPFQISSHSRPGITTLDVHLKPAPPALFQTERSNTTVILTSNSSILPLFDFQTLAIFNRKY